MQIKTKPVMIFFIWYDNEGSEVMRIHDDGNIGMGTNQPQRKLHIKDVLRIEPRPDFPPNPDDGDICVMGSYGNFHIFCYLNDDWKQLD